MRFLVQTTNGKIVYDFAFELERAKEYYDWKGEPFSITYSDEVPNHNVFKDDIPVGSVEFVSRFLMNYYPEAKKALLPLNVPECLFDYAGRLIANVREPDDMVLFDYERLMGRAKHLFRKSLDKIKDERNGLLEYGISQNPFFGFQVSEEIQIESEWRVFVFQNEIKHIANYSGDSMNYPDNETIRRMVFLYGKNNAPIAYTLDVGVSNGKTFVIECHRFFSCGLYGFSDYNHYPKMLSQEWYEMKNMR